MGKRIISQNRGRGTPTYRAPSHRYKADLKHLKVDRGQTVRAEVLDIVHDPARSTPIALVRTESGKEEYVLVPEGVGVGDHIECGYDASIKPGNSLPISKIPEGTPVCNIESIPGDGGKFARASGVYAILIAHERGRSLVQMPSGKLKWFNSSCMATIGVVAGGGRIDKPFVKAGKKYHRMKARAGKYPRVRGVAMNSVDHPFGGGNHQHTGKPKTSSRNAPPGRKVGSIAAKRTGKR